MRAKKTGRALLNGVILILMVMLAGTVAFAEDDSATGCAADPFETYVPLVIQLVWDDGGGASRPEAVEIDIAKTKDRNWTSTTKPKRETITLTAEDNWRYETEDDYFASVVGETCDGYVVSDFRLSAEPYKGEAYLCTITYSPGYTVSYEWSGLPEPTTTGVEKDWEIFLENNYLKPPADRSYAEGDTVHKDDQHYGPNRDDAVCILDSRLGLSTAQFYEFSGWRRETHGADSDTYDMPAYDVKYTGEWTPIDDVIVKPAMAVTYTDFTGTMPFTKEMIDSGKIPLNEPFLKSYRHIFYDPDSSKPGTGHGSSAYIGMMSGELATMIFDSDENLITLSSDKDFEYDLADGNIHIGETNWITTTQAITYTLKTEDGYNLTASNYDEWPLVYSGATEESPCGNYPGQHYEEGDKVYLPKPNMILNWKEFGSLTNPGQYIDNLYIFKEWKVKDSTDQDITDTCLQDGVLTMPKGDVTVVAVYTKNKEDTTTFPQDYHKVTYTIVDTNGDPIGMDSSGDAASDRDIFHEIADKPYYLQTGTVESLLLGYTRSTNLMMFVPGAPMQVTTPRGDYYVFQGWEIIPESGPSVEIIDGTGHSGEDGPLLPSFEMPDSDVTIKGVWEKREETQLHEVVYEAAVEGMPSDETAAFLDSILDDMKIDLDNPAAIGSTTFPLNKGLEDQCYFLRLFTPGQLVHASDGSAYVFEGWSVASESGELSTDTDICWTYWDSFEKVRFHEYEYFLMPDEDVTITTHWKKATFRVSYGDGDGGFTFDRVDTYGLHLDDPTPKFDPVGVLDPDQYERDEDGSYIPIKSGYDFMGWSPEVQRTVTGCITYMPIWEPVIPAGSRCGVLIINKALTGGNLRDEFTFRITLHPPRDWSGTLDNLPAIKLGNGVEYVKAIELDRENTFEVTLTGGQSVVIQCPSGTQYEVEEVDLPSDYEMTSAKRTKGTVFTCQFESIAEFINEGPESPVDPGPGPGPDPGPDEPTPPTPENPITTYRVLHKYYTEGNLDGTYEQRRIPCLIGEKIDPDDVQRIPSYNGQPYKFISIAPNRTQTAEKEGDLVFTLVYERIQYERPDPTPTPDPTPWPDPTPTPTPTPKPDPTPTPTPTPKPDPTPTPTPTPDPDPTPTPLPLPERPVDPGTGLVPYDPTVILEDLVPLAAPHLNITDHYAYIIGYPDGLVRPEGNVTRAEVATIFLRLMLDEYREENWSTENNFSDVAPTAWYNNAVSTCAKAGIIKGYPDGTFRPDANITRAEFAAIAARFVSDDVPGYDYFTDMEGHWARVDVARAVMAGWIRGEGRLFRPQDKITRAETATLVNRMINRFPDKENLLPGMIVWPDNPAEKWFYEDIQEATNSHDYEPGGFTFAEVWTYLLANRDWAALENEWSQAGDAPGGEVAPELQPGGTSGGESDDIQDILGDILGA